MFRLRRVWTDVYLTLTVQYRRGFKDPKSEEGNMALSAAAVAKKWADNMANAGAAMKAGVQAVTINPAAQAAAAKDLWLQGVQRAAAEGSFEAGLANTTLQSWQSSMINKGVPNMQTGVKEGLPKMQAFLQDFLPFAQQVSDNVKAMPKGTLANSIARAAAAITQLASYKKRT